MLRCLKLKDIVLNNDDLAQAMYILTCQGEAARGPDDIGQLMLAIEIFRSFDEILVGLQETAALDVSATTIIQHARIARNLTGLLRTCLESGLVRMSDSTGLQSSMGG